MLRLLLLELLQLLLAAAAAAASEPPPWAAGSHATNYLRVPKTAPTALLHVLNGAPCGKIKAHWKRIDMASTLPRGESAIAVVRNPCERFGSYMYLR